MSVELVLYSTDHCALCDEALEWLFSMPELAGYAVRVVDVATDDALTSEYGERLPVLQVRHSEGTTDLDWPFDPKRLREALVPSIQAE